MGVQHILYILLMGTCVFGKSESESLKFLVIGDWGGLPIFPYRTAIEKAVATRLSSLCHVYDTRFILGLGDNFYFNGVKSVEDPRFQETYNQVFVGNDLDWFLIAGNHDHNGNISAQVEYSKLVKRWNFPSLYYKMRYPIPGSAKSLEIIMIDTVVLCGNSDHDFLYQQPPGPSSISEAETHWIWLENALATSKADYVVVAGHYPVYSIGEHGSTKLLVDRLMPMLHKYNVTAYLSGHDHNMQHLSTNAYNNTVDYFVIGAANFIDPSKAHEHTVPKGSSKYFWANIFSLGALALVDVGNNNATLIFIESNGKILYKHVMEPRH